MSRAAWTRAYWALLPKLLISRTARLLGRIPLPRWARARVYRGYARVFGAALDDVELPLREYRCFGAFFARALRPGARPLAVAPLVWPCDGRVVSAGAIANGRLPQVKGIDYAAADLLADGALGTRLVEGSQATIYLAPGDYHRVHAPFAARLLRVRHVPGGLYPVKPALVRAIPGLFAHNERLVFDFELAGAQPAALVMVAALNVGDLRVTGAVPREVAAGEELGQFGFGSTVVVLLGSGALQFRPEPAARIVRFGTAVT